MTECYRCGEDLEGTLRINININGHFLAGPFCRECIEDIDTKIGIGVPEEIEI